MIKSSYAEILDELSKDRYIVLPLRDYRHTENVPDKIVVGLRHDVDKLLKVAADMANMEYAFKINSTYFMRHTADYFDISDNYFSARIGGIFHAMQCHGHEIGLHNDLLSMYVNRGTDVKDHLQKIMTWFSYHNIKVIGSASHGSSTAREYKFLNDFIFRECTRIKKDDGRNHEYIIKDGQKIVFPKLTMKNYGLMYEAYNLPMKKDEGYISDTKYLNILERIKDLPVGIRVQITIHPNKIIDNKKLWAEWDSEK